MHSFEHFERHIVRLVLVSCSLTSIMQQHKKRPTMRPEEMALLDISNKLIKVLTCYCLSLISMSTLEAQNFAQAPERDKIVLNGEKVSLKQME